MLSLEQIPYNELIVFLLTAWLTGLLLGYVWRAFMQFF